MGKYVTVTEIAKQLGLSHSTVSRALSNNPRISKATREKVQELAKELGYHPNSMAHQLSHGKSLIIGVIVPDLSVSFFSKIVECIQVIVQKEDYCILLFNTMESLEKEQQAIETCLKHRVDGVLAAITMQTKTFEHYERLIRYEVPLVFFDRVANFLSVPKVVANDHKSAYSATKYLIDSGCQCIAHITGSINLNNSNNRLYGYMNALEDHGIEINESLIHYYEFKPLSIDGFLKKIIKKYPLDGLFVFNDYVANYSINVLTKLGKKIPDDISVFGFSDEPIATYMTPQLSSVGEVASKMGRLAAQKLISIIKQEEAMVNEKIVIDPGLVIRGTTRLKQ